MNVYNYSEILVEEAFRATECRLAQMNVFSHYYLALGANDCVFSVNGQQKVQFVKNRSKRGILEATCTNTVK